MSGKLGLRGLCLLIFAILVTLSRNAPAQTNTAPEKLADGIVLPMRDGFLTITVRADDVFRVTFAKDKSFAATKRSIITVPRTGPPPKWDLASDARFVTLSTATLKARVDLATGAIAFLDSTGKPITSEAPDGRTLDPVDIQGEKTYSIRQQWQSNDDESLYGMGENQLNLLNIKGYDLDFWQHNGSVALPMLVSSKGYGILWDNTSWTRIGDLRPFVPVPAQDLFDTTGKSGGLTMGAIAPTGETLDPKPSDQITIVTPLAQPNFTSAAGSQAVSDAFPKSAHPPVDTRWEGQILAPVTGDYQCQTTNSSSIIGGRCGCRGST
jgi:alpha-D-xyloside xylohydrolase